MDLGAPSTQPARAIAVAAAAALLGPACLLSPSRFVAARTPETAGRPLPVQERPAEPGPALAPQPGPAVPAAPRSLSDLVDLALSRDPSTRAAWHDARAAAAAAGRERSAWLPTLDATGTFERRQSPTGAG
ncbi:MAG TPA: TolC family protein, partial [Anaeromyxobacteraceae bacterium]|nr:TolC family protein [Anaeromyxobacteraceae bacterium]